MKRASILQSSISNETAHRGFTLLEVLLASLLTSVILVALWSLADIYLKLFVAGKTKIEETQLVRGITQQFAKDVLQVIQHADEPSPLAGGLPMAITISPSQSVPRPTSSAQQIGNPRTAGARPPGSSPQRTSSQGSLPLGSASVEQFTAGGPAAQTDGIVPKFGLFGSKHALRLIVLQTDPRTIREPSDLADVIPQPGQPRHPFAPELRTIQYSFAWQHEATSDARVHPRGLIRREWAWEAWIDLWRAQHPTSKDLSAAQMRIEDHTDWTDEDATALANGEVFHVAQVTGMEFRYFDGDTWEIEWNSWERRSLPQLVEMLVQVKTTKEHPNAVAPTDEGTEPPLSLTEESSSGSSSEHTSRNGSVYRRLVHLPFAEQSSPTQTPDSTDRITTNRATTSITRRLQP